MYGRKRYPSMVWLLVQASIVFCYTSRAFCKPYRHKIYLEEDTNDVENNKTIILPTNNHIEHSAHIDKDILDPPFNPPAPSSHNKDKSKTNTRAPLLHESVIFKAVVSNINVLTLQEENSTNNGLQPKHFPKAGKQERTDINDSHSTDHRESKAHLKWDGHVVAAPLKYDPQVSNFQTPRKVSDTVSTSKMVLSLLTAAVALGSICLTVAIFQCCCRRKPSSDDEDEDQIIDDQHSKEKATVKSVNTHEQTVEAESIEKDVCVTQTDTPVETPTGQTTIDGQQTVQKASEEEKGEEEEQVSVKDKIKAFETHALKPLSPENVEQHRTLIKRPHSRPISESESEALSSSTTLIMGQVFRKRADTEKCQRKETLSASSVQKVNKDDDYFGVIGRETEVLKSYRRAPAPRNRNKATKALYRKTMPNMNSTERSDMEITMSDWESTVHSFHQAESQFGKQDSKKKKKTPIPLPLPNQNAKDEVDNKLEDSTDGVEKTETKTEETTMETISVSDTENIKCAESVENNMLDVLNSSGDETSQGEESKIKEEMKEDETDKDGKEEVELKKEEEEEEEGKEEEEKKEEEKRKEEEKKKEEEEKRIKEEEKRIEEEKERLIKEEKEKEEKEKEEKEKEKLKKEAEEKEEKKLKEDEKMKERKKAKEEELQKERMNKEKEQEKKREKEKQLKKEKELKREKDEIKREKEELNKEELKKGKEQHEKEAGRAENIFFQIDPTVEPTAAKLVKRDSEHESNETSVHMTDSKDDLPKNDESPKPKRHLAHLDRKTMFMLPGQKPEDHMSLMLSLKEKFNDKKEKNELDADTDTKMDVDPEPETENLEVPEC